MDMAPFAAARKITQQLTKLNSNKLLHAWVLYKSGDTEDALATWRELAEIDDHQGLSARRSLAIHFHSLAYDQELEGNSQAERSWTESLLHWAHLFKSRGFRSELGNLSTVQSDLRLNENEIPEMIDALSRSILAPHVTLACQQAERGQYKHAGNHITIIRKSAFDPGLTNELLENVIDRICPISTDEISAASHTKETIDAITKRGNLALQHYPDHVNGTLAVTIGAIWYGRDATHREKGYENAWSKILNLKQKGVLQRLKKLKLATSNNQFAHVISTRLKELSGTASNIQHDLLIDLIIKRGKAIDAVNSYQSSSNLKKLRSVATQIMNPDRKKDIDLCAEINQLTTTWTKEYDSLLDEVESANRTAREDISALTDIGH